MREASREHERSSPGPVDNVKALIDVLALDESSSFEDVELSGQYLTLTPGEQATVRSYAESKGLRGESSGPDRAGKKIKKDRQKRQKTKDHEAPPLDLVAAPDAVASEAAPEVIEPSVTAPAVEAPAANAAAEVRPEAAPASQASLERREARENRDRWEFLGYTAIVAPVPRRDGHGTVINVSFKGPVTEHRADGNDVTTAHNARFYFSDQLFERLRRSPELLDRACRELSDLRREIDQEDVSLILDPARDREESFVPKWVYYLGGKRHDEPFSLKPDPQDRRRRIPDFEQMPPEVVDVIKNYPKTYFRSEPYRRWFRRAMAQKRDEVIGRVWESRQEEPEAALPAPAPETARPAKEAPVVAKTEAAAPPVEAAKPAVETTAPDAKPVRAARSLYQSELVSVFGGTDHPATEEDMRAGVRQLVSDLGAMITTETDVEERLPRFFDFALAGLKEQAMLAGRTPEEKDFPERRYAIVRQAVLDEMYRMLAINNSPHGPERWQNLGEQRRIRESSDILLTEDEVKFINEHPELEIEGISVREVEDDKKSRIVVMRRLESGHEAEDLRKLVEAAVFDALDGAKPPLDDIEEIGSRLATYLLNYVNGPQINTPSGIRFLKDYLDIENGKAVIRDYAKLAEAIRRLAVHMHK